MGFDDYADVTALGLNDHQHGDEDHLNSVDPHMLAAFCFDLTRKQHYQYMALRLSNGATGFRYRGYGISDQTSLAAAIRADTVFVEETVEAVRMAKGPLWNRARDWEARARALQEVIIAQWRAIKEDHDGLYEGLTREGPPECKAAPGHDATRARANPEWPQWGPGLTSS